MVDQGVLSELLLRDDFEHRVDRERVLAHKVKQMGHFDWCRSMVQLFLDLLLLLSDLLDLILSKGLVPT